MAIIKCENCGGNVSDKAKACPHCGKVINQETTFSVQTNPQQVGPSKGGVSSPPIKKSPASRIILTVLGTLLLLYLAIIAFGYVKYGFFSANPVHWRKVIDAERGDAGVVAYAYQPAGMAKINIQGTA